MGGCFAMHDDEEHLGAVAVAVAAALTDCARGVHTHPLASYFLVRPYTDFRLLIVSML